MKHVESIAQDNNPTHELGISKFETCLFRTSEKITKQSCCSMNNVSGYKCNLRNIFPLSYIQHCEKCDKYEH
jgi:hypothetical protein